MPKGTTVIDVSEDQNNSIVAYSSGTEFIVTSKEKGKPIYSNPNSDLMFASNGSSNTVNVSEIDFTNFSASKIISMEDMFFACGSNVNSFKMDISDWDVSNVKVMYGSFISLAANATEWSIGKLDNWDVSSVENFNSMFGGTGEACTSWTIGDLSKWDTSSAIDICSMFAGTGMNATNYTLGDLSTKQVQREDGTTYTAWDVSNVKTFGQKSGTSLMGMFTYAGKNSQTFDIGDISNWDTSNAVNMSGMFYYTGPSATYITPLDLSSWNVNNVTQYDSFNVGSTSKVTAPTWKN